MDDNTRKELYKLTVAKIELERSRVAADIYSKEYHDFMSYFQVMEHFIFLKDK